MESRVSDSIPGLLAEVFEWNENKAFEITSFTMGADSDALGLLNRNNPYTSGTKPRQLWLFIHYGGHSLVCASVLLA